MKTKLFISFILVLFFAGCKTDNSPEIINLNDNSYISERDFGWQFPLNFKLNTRNERKDLFKSIDEKLKEEGLTVLLNDRYQLMIYLNEKGKFDKVIILNGDEERVARIIIDKLSEIIDKPVYKDSIPVKFQFTFWYFTEMFRNLERGSDVDSPPTPIGGMAAIQKNIHYPELAKRAGIEGTVYIRTDIDQYGNVTNTNILEGIGSGCDEAAINAVKQVKFKPAVRDSMPVKYYITIPIKFTLQ
jgi:TonB family protein